MFGLLNFYIGLRGWQFLFQYLPAINSAVYWAVFWAVSLSYPVARVGRGFFPEKVSWAVTLLGAYWLAAMFYFLQIIVIVDLLKLANRFFPFVPASVRSHPRYGFYLGVGILVLVAGIIIYGSWNARRPQIQHYDLTIPKQAGDLQQLHVVMVSDIHLGEIIHNGRLTKMVEMVNRLAPDVVLLPGDVVDEDIGPFIRQGMAANFQRLQAKYGVYACPGNHEYIGGHTDEIFRFLELGGIRELRDNYVKIADSFYLIGQDDSSHSSRDEQAKPHSLSTILAGVDTSFPLILLKHQPTQLEEAEAAGVDLQLSGHTHQGQMFPNQYITSRVFEKDWGYLQKGSLQLIVSSGFGTWGPPIRIGNKPEIVDILITFK